MRVIPPVPITDAKLTSSTAVEPFAPAAYNPATTYAYGAIVSVAADFVIYESLAADNIGHTPKTSPAWWKKIGATEASYNPATTYAAGDTVSSSATHRVYESLLGSNTGNPLPVYPETKTTYWQDVGSTIKWAMFDLNANTQTICASPLTVVITPGERINSIGLAGLVANSVTISATSVKGGGTIYGPVTIDLNRRKTYTFYDFCFAPFFTSPTTVVFNIPPYVDVVVTITISSTSGNVKCGGVAIGRFDYIGEIKYGATNDGLNFSTVDRDTWGNANLVPRRTLPKTDQVLSVPSYYVERIKKLREDLNAVPAFWAGVNDSSNSWFDALAILGIYTQLKIGVVENNMADITLSLEEI